MDNDKGTSSMEKVIDALMHNPEVLIIGVLSSILATIVVLFTRKAYLALENSLPAGKLFNHVKGSNEIFVVHQKRLKDVEQKGTYLIPIPDFSSFPAGEPKFELCQHIPWVLSSEDSNASAMVLNVLGQIGRTDNIKLSYVDEEYDHWENPMFLIGGSIKTIRVFEKFTTPYYYKDGAFINRENNTEFRQKTGNDDIGLLMKTYYPPTGKPIWIAMGMRGAGTAGATYALQQWWKILGKLYGSNEFGLVVQFSDMDGWKDSTPIDISPKPKKLRRIFHPIANKKLNSLLKNY